MSRTLKNLHVEPEEDYVVLIEWPDKDAVSMGVRKTFLQYGERKTWKRTSAISNARAFAFHHPECQVYVQRAI